jgi:RNA polymerase sigma-70 factor, ECF subfamily
MEELSEIEIALAAKSEAGFRKLYNHYSPFVWRVAFRTANGDQQIAKEVLQSVFISVNRSLKKFNHKSVFSSWLYKICWRESIHLVKKERNLLNKMVPLSGLEVSEENYKFSEEEVNSLLVNLTPEQRFLLVSREIEGFSFAELSEISGKKEGTLRVTINRIKSKLKREVEYER